MTQPQAIHAHCLRCCNGHEDEVTSCPCNDCTLHPYRLGTSGPEATERAALFTGRMAPPKHRQRIETRKENEVV